MFSDSFDFSVHSAGQHIESHFVIRNKRPKRIFKTRRFVFLDDEMRKPREGITDCETKRQIKPVSAANDPDKQNDSERRADKMKKPRQRLIVFGDVKIPKLRVSFNVFNIFRHNFSPQRFGYEKTDKPTNYINCRSDDNKNKNRD